MLDVKFRKVRHSGLCSRKSLSFSSEDCYVRASSCSPFRTHHSIWAKAMLFLGSTQPVMRAFCPMRDSSSGQSLIWGSALSWPGLCHPKALTAQFFLCPAWCQINIMVWKCSMTIYFFLHSFTFHRHYQPSTSLINKSFFVTPNQHLILRETKMTYQLTHKFTPPWISKPINIYIY